MNKMEGKKEEIYLIIKSANQRYDDIKINCDLSWSVLDLKNHLSVNYPSKPKTSDQRIIYSGHLLTNNQLMRNIVELSGDKNQNVFTFHLVCPQKFSVNANKKADNTMDHSNNPTISTAIPVPNNNPTTSNPISADTFSSSSSSSPSSSSTSAPVSSMPSGWNAINQLSQLGPDNMLMQQSYQLLMNQYCQYMSYFLLTPPIDFASYAAFTTAFMQSLNNQQQAQSPPSSLQPTASASSSNNNENNRPNINNNNNRVDVVNGVGVNRLINQGDDEDGMNRDRDWTDWIYSISQAVVMFSVLYFYSSLNRLVLFMSIFFIIYFYKNLLNGINPLNNNNRNRPAEEQQRGGNIRNADGGIDRNHNPSDIGQDNNNNLGDNNIQDPNQNTSRISGLRFVWVFITSLFTSLIPDSVPVNN